MFEGFDRAGQLRAICGGGRYDRLLGTFGGEDQPCAGFGFGDAVIVELLKDRGLLPQVRGGAAVCVCGRRKEGGGGRVLRARPCLLHPCSRSSLPAGWQPIRPDLAACLLLLCCCCWGPCLPLQLPHEVDDLVMAQEEGLRGAATQVAARLRAAGRRVDLVLEDGKRLKWAFKQAERCGAGEEAPPPPPPPGFGVCRRGGEPHRGPNRDRPRTLHCC